MTGSHRDLNFSEVKNGLKNESIVYLDVRNQSELITDGKIPGSAVIPLPEIEKAFLLDESSFKSSYGFEKPGKDASNVVVACRSGRRVEQAIEILDKMGYHSLSTYKGSFLDWKAKGGDIVFG